MSDVMSDAVFLPYVWMCVVQSASTIYSRNGGVQRGSVKYRRAKILKVLHLHLYIYIYIYIAPFIHATEYVVVLDVCERNLEIDIQLSRRDVKVWQLRTAKDFFLKIG
jgi:hypothetical protein